MSALYELSIVRKKLVIKTLREMTTHDLVAVRETTLNSIDFIMGDDDIWDYIVLAKSCLAITKVRLAIADQIIQFIKDNGNKLVLDSIDRVFLSDLTKVHKIEIEGKNEKELKTRNKDSFAKQQKEKILSDLTNTVKNINDLAGTMGEIL